MSIWVGYPAGLSDAEQTRGLADGVEAIRNRIACRAVYGLHDAHGNLTRTLVAIYRRSHGHHMALERGLVKAVRTGENRRRRIARADRSRHRSGPRDRVARSGKAHGPSLSAHGSEAPQHTATRTSSSVSSCSGGGMTRRSRCRRASSLSRPGAELARNRPLRSISTLTT